MVCSLWLLPYLYKGVSIYTDGACCGKCLPYVYRGVSMHELMLAIARVRYISIGMLLLVGYFKVSCYKLLYIL